MICCRDNIGYAEKVLSCGKSSTRGSLLPDHVFLKLFHGNMNYRTQTAVYNIIIKHFVPRFVDTTVIAAFCIKGIIVFAYLRYM